MISTRRRPCSRAHAVADDAADSLSRAGAATPRGAGAPSLCVQSANRRVGGPQTCARYAHTSSETFDVSHRTSVCGLVSHKGSCRDVWVGKLGTTCTPHGWSYASKPLVKNVPLVNTEVVTCSDFRNSIRFAVGGLGRHRSSVATQRHAAAAVPSVGTLLR